MPSPRGHLVLCLAVVWTLHPGPATHPLPPPRTLTLASLPPAPPRVKLLRPAVQTPPREAQRPHFSMGFRF